MKGDDTLSESMNKPLLVIDDYTTPVIVKDFLTRQYKEEIDENGETVLRELPVSVLPDIELYVNIGGTNYYVSGAYTGTGSAEDKISQILMRDMEV
ncbi:MAG: hypothetical protein IKD99_03800 [Erysipelotrichaceae bacterium]|nr:hypothetical protein [Erysipelotrichaceae bacterium]